MNSGENKRIEDSMIVPPSFKRNNFPMTILQNGRPFSQKGARFFTFGLKRLYRRPFRSSASRAFQNPQQEKNMMNANGGAVHSEMV